MLTDTPPSADQAAAAARKRVSIGEVPGWVKPETAASTVAPKTTTRADHLTYLFVDRQVNAETHQTYHRVVVRLESMQAVQHESQWRLQIDPATQSVILHGIKIRRSAEEVEHARLEKIRFLEREEGLETFILDGRFTLLLVLDDVRPGDVLETCYTIEHRSRVMPDHCTCLFTLPPALPVLRHRFSVVFPEQRTMKWKTSPETVKPVETRQGELLHWEWTGQDYVGRKPDPNTPEWHLGFPWIHISDCPSWNTVASAVARAWNATEDATLDEIAQGIAARHSAPAARVTAALDFVQNEFRYLSVNLDLGGQIPTAPGTVARRRFGDCKDFSWLLVQLLRRLQVKARPVLVNTVWGKGIDQILPATEVFNHAVVEFEINGVAKWVDPTMKYQGGTALERFIPDCHWGLPVDSEATALVRAPVARDGLNLYEIKETLLLDTNRGASLLGVVCRTRGLHAEIYRRDFELRGVDEIARDRLQAHLSRFGQASRVGTLQYRDDRDVNEFVFAEVFEVNGFIAFDPQADVCLVRFPNAVIPAPLPPPDNSPRHCPYALPYPCELTYTVEVEAANLAPMAQPRCYLDNDFFRFSRRERSLNKFWALTFTLSTLRDAVPPGQMDDYRKAVERLCAECGWQLYMPVGYARPRQTRDFAQLPDPPFRPPARTEPSSRAPTATSETRAPAPVLAANPAPAAHVAAAGAAPATSAAPASLARPLSYADPRPGSDRGRRRRKRREKSSPVARYLIIGGALLVFIVLVILLSAAR